MFGDYEDELRDKVDTLVDTYGETALLDLLDLSVGWMITKLIVEGHIDEEDLPRAL